MKKTLLNMHASLAVIGRTQPIEMEDPPDADADLDDDPFVNEKNQLPAMNLHEVSFVREQAEKMFYRMSQNALVPYTFSSFSCCHSEDSLRIGRDLLRVFQIEYQLQIMELRQKITSTLQEFQEFTRQVELLVYQEIQLLNNCSQDSGSGGLNSHLGFLRTLCETLRLNLNQPWTLCNHVQQNVILQRNMLRLKPLLSEFIMHHHQLASRCICLTHELIQAGLLVLSHCDLTRYTNDDLWEISRGIEEFNIILSHIQQQCHRKVLKRLYVDEDVFSFNHAEALIQRVDQLRPISFSRILRRLASERSTQVVNGVFRFLFINEDVLHAIKRKIFEVVEWNENEGRESVLSDRDSGLHSDSINRDTTRRSARDSSQGLSSPHKSKHAPSTEDRLDAIVNQFRELGPPMNEYLRMEYEFASGFLDIISRSTEMLKNLHNPKKKRIVKEETFDSFMAPVPTLGTGLLKSEERGSMESPDGREDKGTSAGQGSTKSKKAPRKGVQWSDDKEVTVRHQVIGLYLDIVWREVDQHMDQLLVSHLFSQSRSDGKLCLGHISILSPSVLLFLAQVLKKVAIPDLFSPNFLPTLRNQALKLKLRACIASWDACMCRSNAYSLVESLMPVQLDEVTFCSRFCKSLLESIEPLASIIITLTHEILEMAAALAGEKLSKGSLGQSQSMAHVESLIIVISHCVTYLLASSKAALLWIRTRGERSMAGEKLSQLQFIIYADLPLLWNQCNENVLTLRRLSNISPASSSVSATLQRLWPRMQTDIGTLVKTTNTMQTCATSLTQQFRQACYERALESLRQIMPRNVKIWKAKSFSSLSQESGVDSTVNLDVQAQQCAPKDRSLSIGSVESGVGVTLSPLPYVNSLLANSVDDLLHSCGLRDLRRNPCSQYRNMIEAPIDELCNAWQYFILKELKTKFSYCGACQLNRDIMAMREYLENALEDERARNSLLGLKSMVELEAGIAILKRQRSPRALPSPNAETSPQNNQVTAGVTGDRSKRERGELMSGDHMDGDGQGRIAGNASYSNSTNCPSLPCFDVDSAQQVALFDLEDYQFHPYLKEWLSLRASPEEGRRFRPFCRN